MNTAPQPRSPMNFEPINIPLFEGETIINVQPYRVETVKPRKWEFWKKENVKHNIAVLTSNSRFFIIDPSDVTVTEKVNY